jgi:hypothetical protein
MKRLTWTIALLPLAGAPCTYAQSIPVTQSFGFGTNVVGDNLGSTLTGPGVNLFAGGGTDCPWCDSGFLYNTPGSSLNPSTQIFYDYVQGSLTVGGQTYCQDGVECSFYTQGIFASRSITFPTNGQNFTVTIPVGLDSITVDVTPLTAPDFFVTLNPSGGDLTLTFDFVPALPNGPPAYYAFAQGTFPATVSTPEPGPLGLMAAGLVGILGLGLKRRLPAFF